MLMRSTRHTGRGFSQRGFTLIEVLVTIVVVSIGLLGLAGLQISGLRANTSSEARSKATLLANDIVERMRANPLGVAAGGYDAIVVDDTTCAGALPSPFCSNTSSDAAEDCTATEMAAFDARVWACGLPVASGVQPGGITHQLSSGTASVTCNAAPCVPGSSFTVTVSWSELSPNATDTVSKGESTTQTLSLVVVP